MKLTIEDLEVITLNHGHHRTPDDGHCLLEVVSMFAGEAFSEEPQCVDPVLRGFGIRWNDGMRSDEERAQLKQYIIRLVGTNKGPALSRKRGWMALDWHVRVHCAAWLALNPRFAHHAHALQAHPQITCVADLSAIQPKLDAAKNDAASVWAAARDAAWSAARDAAWDAAWAAAGAAAGAAARDAAWAATRAAAGAAAWAAAGAAAGAAARAAVLDDAGAAARAAVLDDAGAKLQPTVLELQKSAHNLFSRMIDAA